MVCSKCGKKLWIWNEIKYHGSVYCESCFNDLKSKSKTVSKKIHCLNCNESYDIKGNVGICPKCGISSTIDDIGGTNNKWICAFLELLIHKNLSWKEINELCYKIMEIVNNTSVTVNSVGEIVGCTNPVIQGKIMNQLNSYTENGKIKLTPLTFARDTKEMLSYSLTRTFHYIPTKIDEGWNIKIISIRDYKTNPRFNLHSLKSLSTDKLILSAASDLLSNYFDISFTDTELNSVVYKPYMVDNHPFLEERMRLLVFQYPIYHKLWFSRTHPKLVNKALFPIGNGIDKKYGTQKILIEQLRTMMSDMNLSRFFPQWFKIVDELIQDSNNIMEKLEDLINIVI